MNVCVLGLWHLGSVTAACAAAAGHTVIGVDFDAAVVEGLNNAVPPILEPGLADLLQQGLSAGRLSFTTDVRAACQADLVWVAYDTPVDDEDRADVEYVREGVRRILPEIRDGAVVLISSQVPVGTTRQLQRERDAAGGRTVHFAYSPENLRLGSAIAVFTRPDRVVVGTESREARDPIAALFEPFTQRIEWMSIESAEMAKHALNAFLATSVAFANEIAALCEQTGADAGEVERALKSDQRIGSKAYLSPGAAFAGGTLARDVVFLSEVGRTSGVPTDLLSSVKTSNDHHRRWAERRLDQLLGGVSGKSVAVWGLTYKPGTNTLRRSGSIELCATLVDRGASVRAHDPAVPVLPPGAPHVDLAESAVDAVRGADALVVMTPWPEYREIPAARVASEMAGHLVLDAHRCTRDTIGADPRFEYVTVGKTVGARR